MNKTFTNIDESFSIVVELLIREGYKRIQYLPHSPARYIGHEFLIIRSFLLKNNVTIFRSSGLDTVYKKVMKYVYPKTYNLYRLFFRCEEFPLPVFLNFFNQHELDILIRNGILSCTNGQCISNYRFVPIDDLLIICSPSREYDTAKYVYIGGDSIIFWNFLKKTFNNSVRDALEIGCGTGFLSIWMSQIAQKVTATDISPRALEFTRLNAKINGINNIVTKLSDVYADIQDKFDLIISNPPFIFLPEECIGLTYAFADNLGTEIVRRICLGLDDHLKDGGISIIMAQSYIKKDGTNPLYEMIKNIFQGKSYSISLQQFEYQPITKHFSFYEKHEIAYYITYWIVIKKSKQYELTHVPIQGASKVIENLKIKLLYRRKQKD